jgi:hypothetical protein
MTQEEEEMMMQISSFYGPQAFRGRAPLCLRISESPRLPVVFLLLAACLLLPSSVRAQETVDKMVATVNAGVQTDCKSCLITYSDLLWQLALQADTPLDNPTSETLNGVLRLVEDQRLILQEAEKLPALAPRPDEITAARNYYVKRFASQSVLQERMKRVGLTSEKFEEIVEQRVRTEKYLDFRFRNFILITRKEIEDYYRDAYVPDFRRRFSGRIVPTLDEARPGIEQTLTEGKIETYIDNFLDSARDHAEIVILNPV